jgi:beta-lactamase class A
VTPGLLILLAALAGRPPDLAGQLERISLDAKGRVGAAATVLESGDSVSFHPHNRFPMQSVYKLPIGMAVLDRVDRGALAPDRNVRVDASDLVSPAQHSPIRNAHPRGGVEMSVRDLLRYMVAESDGSACDVLLRTIGGPERVMAYLRGLGLSGIAVANTEREMGRGNDVQYRNYASPSAMVALLRALQTGRGLSASSRALLLQLMTETGTGVRRIKGLLPPETVVAHKTGSSGTVNGLTAATNDVGIVTLPDGRHMAIAVFVSDSRADDAVRDAVIARIARALWDHWTAPR